MKQKTLLLLTALVAMFAFSTAADAQNESLLPQPAPQGTPQIVLKWFDKEVGVWDPVKMEIIRDIKYTEGEYAGKNISYKYDPATGSWMAANGKPAGKIYADGTIESPLLGKLLYAPKHGYIFKDGVIIGEASKSQVICYDTPFGKFEGEVSPLLAAYTFFGVMVTEGQLKGFQDLKRKRDSEKRINDYKANPQKYNYSNKATIKNNSGKVIGYIDGEKVMDANKNLLGYARSSGRIDDARQQPLGYLFGDSSVRNSNQQAFAYFDGTNFKNIHGEVIGTYNSGSFWVTKPYSTNIGRLEGKGDKNAAVACFYFFFFSKYASK